LRFEKSAGLILFRREKNSWKYLLLENKGLWGFPKGRVEKGESELEAALRECREETGIKKLKVIPGFRESEDYFYRDVYDGSNELVKKRVVYFLAETSERKVKISFEHQNYKWAGFKEVETFFGSRSTKRVVERVEKFLSGKPSLEKWF
jgi:tRNA nucleotidyltransferase (CCA-adding enzyme)